MRILTFTSLFPNSAAKLMGIFVCQRMRHLNLRKDCEVDVVAPVPYSSRVLPRRVWRRLAEIARRERIEGLDVYHPRYLMLPKVGLPMQGLSMALCSYALVRRLHHLRKYDCIDAHYVYPDGFAAVFLGRLLGVPVLVSARGTDMTLYPSFSLIAPMIRYTLRRADGLMAVSSELAQAMVTYGGLAEKIAIIGNGVDGDRFFPIPPQEARRHLGIPADSRVIVVVGNLREVKGHRHIVDAFKRVAEQFPNVRCFIIGEGELRSEIEHQVRKLGLSAQVALIGEKPNEQLRYWYSAADVSCLASSREGWPNVLLESMACGTPVVATRCGGIPEVISSPILGLMVERSSESLAAGMESALRRDWDRNAIAEHARSRTWDVVASEVEQFIRRVADPKSVAWRHKVVENVRLQHLGNDAGGKQQLEGEEIK